MTDDWDRRTLVCILNKFYVEDVLATERYTYSSSGIYFCPPMGDVSGHHRYLVCFHSKILLGDNFHTTSPHLTSASPNSLPFTSLHLTSTHLTSHHLTFLTSPHLHTSHLTPPHLPYFTSPPRISPHTTSPPSLHLTSPHLTSTHLSLSQLPSTHHCFLTPSHHITPCSAYMWCLQHICKPPSPPLPRPPCLSAV